MGAGGSQEAEWTLVDDIRAGEWTLIADCLVIQSVDVRFEIFWRKTGGGGDVPIVMWERHFDPGANINRAQAHELRGRGPAIEGYTDGDQLIFRYTGLTGTIPMAWVPNSEGARTMGRIPHIIPP